MKCVSCTPGFGWFKLLKEEREETENDPHSGRPSKSATDETSRKCGTLIKQELVNLFTQLQRL